MIFSALVHEGGSRVRLQTDPQTGTEVALHLLGGGGGVHVETSETVDTDRPREAFSFDLLRRRIVRQRNSVGLNLKGLAMDKRFLGILAGIGAVVVLIALVFVATRPPSDIVEPAPLPTSDDIVQDSTPKSQPRDEAKPDSVEMATAPDTEPAVVPPTGTEDLSLYEEDLLDDDVVARLHEEFGSYSALYAAITPTQREELIDWLSGEDMLREEVGTLLPIERDSDLRAYLLRRVEPKGFWDGDEHADDDEYVDADLIAILDNPTDTAINSEEWMARMDLATLIDPEYALQWTRESRLAHPDDMSVNMLAATHTMTLASSIEGVTAGETAAAENYIRETFTGPRAGELTSDERVKGYYALYWSPDREETREFYRGRLEHEDDPRARQTLEGLLERLDRRLAGGQ